MERQEGSVGSVGQLAQSQCEERWLRMDLISRRLADDNNGKCNGGANCPPDSLSLILRAIDGHDVEHASILTLPVVSVER